jgi:hypothetical protein
MGTSLTGLTPATTYDALIKVGDNGPLSATAKVLSDGLGNDSPLAMSTTLVGIGTTSPVRKLTVSGDDDGTLQLRLLGNASTTSYAELGRESMSTGNFTIRLARNGTVITPLVINDQNGNVGIGTTSPNTKLQVNVNNATATLRIKGGLDTITSAGQVNSQIDFAGNDTSVFEDDQVACRISSINEVFNGAKVALAFSTYNQPTFSEVMRLTNDGFIRMASGTGGIQFNGDTATANALDDYEEGTWTMGITFGGGSTGITYVNNTGTYTKIGRQVTVNGLIQLSNKGTDTGIAKITGLPFTVPNNTANYSTATLWFFNIDFANQFQSVADINTTNISLFESTESGTITSLNDTDFANNSEIILSLTYFV